jgi:adiponectin receptor
VKRTMTAASGVPGRARPRSTSRSRSKKGAAPAVVKPTDPLLQIHHHKKLRTIEEISACPKHAYLAYNPWLLTGYRPTGLSVWEALRSMFALHNETFNIWSHLVGFCFVLYLLYDAVFLWEHSAHNNLAASPLPMLFFLGGAGVCLLGSTIYHIFYNVSEDAFKTLMAIDYCGITFLVAGKAAAGAGYGHCGSTATFYLALVGLTAVATVAITMLTPGFSDNSANAFRVTVFAVSSLVCSVPIFHLLLEQLHLIPYAYAFGDVVGADSYEVWTCVMLFFVSAGVFLAGGAIYSAKWPDKAYPGRFDYLGASHHLMHCSVVMGIVLHAIGLHIQARWRSQNPCPAVLV